MPKIRTLTLTKPQEETLEAMRDHHPTPYLRERAAALLKISAGQSGRQVALHGLHKPRKPDTVYSWLDRYETEGLGGLYHRNGRGRKPAFFPSVQDRK